MPDNDKIKVIIEQRGEANLRKLARALISLAQRQLEAGEQAAAEANE